MKVSLEWLAEHVVIEADAAKIVDVLTMAGVEVEGVETKGLSAEGVVVCRILSSARHPNADRLSLCDVETGAGTRRIVCGAKNYKVGDLVPLALPGVKLGGGLTIKESKIRGELSQGMMCSGKELGISDDQEGLMILPPETPVGIPLSRLYPPETVFEVEVTPNRPDLLSHEGMARELVACGAARWREGRPAAAAGGAPAGGFEVAVEARPDCPCYTATVIEGVRVGESPAWMQRRLGAVGLRPINNIVDITNYVLLELGQPMHAFDAARLEPAGRIEVRRGRRGEKLAALDHNAYEVGPDDVVIADGRGPVALGGVIGGEPSAVVEGTTRIVLEVARFDPALIRRTSRRLGVSTDSSYRFERGTDPALVGRARARAVALIAELAGGRVAGSGAVEQPAAEARRVKLRQRRVVEVIGAEVEPSAVRRALEGIGCAPGAEKEGALEWGIPSWRGDLVREIDLIEEVARITGIDAVPARVAFGPAAESAEDRDYDFRMALRRRLAGMGFDEILTSTLGHADGDSEKLANAMVSDQVSLRASLEPQTLRVVADNLDQGNNGLRLFHLGKVFAAGREEWRLALAVSGPDRPAHWGGAARAMDVFDLKGILEALGLPGDAARPVGRAELKERGIRQPVAFAETRVPARSEDNARFRAWPVYPAVDRDVALVVGRERSHAEIEGVFREARIPLLERTVLFDVFVDDTGARLPKERKSLAYSVRYRSAERTLTDEEVNRAHEALKAELRRRLGCEFRE